MQSRKKSSRAKSRITKMGHTKKSSSQKQGVTQKSDSDNYGRQTGEPARQHAQKEMSRSTEVNTARDQKQGVMRASTTTEENLNY